MGSVLVGRDDELGRLREAWDVGGRTVVVRGPAGIGKSRLVRELAAQATAEGGTVLSGRATATGATAPLRPLAEALLGGARRGIRPGPDLAPFVPTLAALVPEWGHGAPSTLLLGEAILRLLVDVGGDRTASLVLDDLQWADSETLAVVDYLADNVEGWPVLLVLTVRGGEPGPGADLAADLVRRRAGDELVLGAVSPGAVIALARDRLGGEDVPDEAVDALVARSEGVPFLVEELVATAATSGWDSIAAAVPGSVVTSVELRVDALPAPARPLLAAAALLGRAFDWAVAAAAARVADDEAVDLLRRAVRVQVVEVDGAGYCFRHALSRDAVLAATPPPELAMLAGRALDVLTAGPPRAETDLVAADLAERAGQRGRAAALLLDAARRALASGAVASAERFASRAASLEPGDEVDAVLLDVAVLSGRTERAAALGRDLLARQKSPADQATLHLRLGGAALVAGHHDGVDDHADAARRLAPDDLAVRARADSLTAQAAMGRDDIDVALVHAARALDGARAESLHEVVCEALEIVGRVERGRDLAAAEVAFQEAHDTAAAHDLALWRVRALHELGTIDMYDSLDLDRLQEARRDAISLGAVAIAATVDLQLAAVYDERGELDQALAAARRCEEASRRWGLGTLPMSLVLQGMAHARRGAHAEVERIEDAALATGEDVDYVRAGLAGTVWSILALVDGDLDAALVHLDEAMTVIRARPAATLPIPGLWALVAELCERDGDEARHEVAGLPFDTPVSRHMLRGACAVALGRAGDGDAAVAALADAEVGLVRHGGGFRYPLIQLLVAPAAHRDGWGDPVGWLRQALASFDAMGLDALAARARRALRDVGAPVPRRTRAATTDRVPPSLAALAVTAREVDVLLLVADGMTNREVAQQLYISPRTVDKHVEHLLQKTGTSRQGLAAIARDAGLFRT